MSGSDPDADDDPFAELDRLFDRLSEGFTPGGLSALAPVSVDVAETDLASFPAWLAAHEDGVTER